MPTDMQSILEGGGYVIMRSRSMRLRSEKLMSGQRPEKVIKGQRIKNERSLNDYISLPTFLRKKLFRPQPNAVELLVNPRLETLLLRWVETPELRLLMIAIGAYLPGHIMSPVHCSPADSILLHHDVKSKLSVGMRWGTFVLTESVNQPPRC